MQMLHRRNQVMHRLLHRRNMHRRGEAIVARLPHVHMIVRVHGLFATHRAAEQLDRAVGNDLVGIHVRLRARAGLPNDERELIVQLAIHHFRGRRHNGFADFLVQHTQIHIHLRGSPLQHAKRPHQRLRHRLATDFKVHQRARRLRTPVFVRGHTDFTERIGFLAQRGERFFYRCFCSCFFCDRHGILLGRMTNSLFRAIAGAIHPNE